MGFLQDLDNWTHDVGHVLLGKQYRKGNPDMIGGPAAGLQAAADWGGDLAKAVKSKGASKKPAAKTPDAKKPAANPDVPYDVTGQLQHATAGDVGSLLQLLGVDTGQPTVGGQAPNSGPGGAWTLAAYLQHPTSQNLAQLTTQAEPSLAGYLQAIGAVGGPLAGQAQQAVQQGAENTVGALAPMSGDLQSQIANAAAAGQLQDLLAAAKYQAIYKQSQYGQPPTNNPQLKSLYNTVVQGGNALTGALPGLSTQPSPTSTTGTYQQGNAFGG